MFRGNHIDAEKVRKEAESRWFTIFDKLVPGKLDDAMRRPGAHVGCPVCGGTDRFRLYRDARKTGGGWCNNCYNPRTGKRGFGDGFDLLLLLLGWGPDNFPRLLEEIADVLQMPEPEQPVQRRNEGGGDRRHPQAGAALERRTPVFDADAERDERIWASLRRVWQEAVPLSHPDAFAGRLYLFNRGLNSLPWEECPFVRLHPSLAYWEVDPTSNRRQKVGEFPCLVFRVLDAEDQTVTLHRIYLTQDGRKAPVSDPKKLMEVPSNRSMTGACIRLGPPGPVLGIAEGPETALAVQIATGIPCWSAISATFLPFAFPTETFEVPAQEEDKGFVASVIGRIRRPQSVSTVKRTHVCLPEGVEAVAVWADLDRSGAGEMAAKDLKRILMTSGIQCQVWLPQIDIPDGVKGVDWLDVFVEMGRSGFPRQVLAEMQAMMVA